MRAVVEEITEDIVVLLVGPDETKVHFPRELLPADIKESDILTITITVDKKETAAQKEKVQNLTDQLKNRN